MQRNQLHKSGHLNSSAYHENSSTRKETDKNRNIRGIMTLVNDKIRSDNEIEIKSISDSVENVRDRAILHVESISHTKAPKMDADQTSKLQPPSDNTYYNSNHIRIS